MKELICECLDMKIYNGSVNELTTRLQISFNLSLLGA
jgi:hypothetical protein